MASIVKELDKVSGTTTRSHNIADAVSKLAGGGSGNGGSTIVNVVADGSDNAPPVVRSIDKTPGEIIAAIEAGNYVIARVVINYPNETYPILYFLNPLKQIMLNNKSAADGEPSKFLFFWNSEVSLIIPQDENLPEEISLSGGSSPGPQV